jgi:hypothetical protein
LPDLRQHCDAFSVLDALLAAARGGGVHLVVTPALHLWIKDLDGPVTQLRKAHYAKIDVAFARR